MKKIFKLGLALCLLSAMSTDVWGMLKSKKVLAVFAGGIEHTYRSLQDRQHLGEREGFKQVKHVDRVLPDYSENGKMPDKDTLKEKLAGFDDFVEKTGIIEQLAGKEVTPLQVAVVIEDAFAVYNKKCEKGHEGRMTLFDLFCAQNHKRFTEKAIFKVLCPGRLVEMQELGIYE